MLEAAQILGGFSALLLIVAIAAWVKLFCSPTLQHVDGSAAATVVNAEIASQLLVLAVSLSAVAALLAVAGWFTV